MENPKVLNDFLSGKLPEVKTQVHIPVETILNLCVAVLLMLVVAFIAYKTIVKK